LRVKQIWGFGSEVWSSIVEKRELLLKLKFIKNMVGPTVSEKG
jgi:hypothetical protein